ncbi:MAG: hypothetical protein HOQ28_16820 [Thermoleophilia bacterium]|nr:hypothetical protein [Thermoleophilia bacterium]
MGSGDANRSFPPEVGIVWVLFVADAIAMFVTYARLPPRELYHVSGSGLEGGASRVLVFSNYSTALVAIAVLAVVADRLARRVTTAAAVAALVLCAAVFWPGVVDQANLDAKPSNAIAALGVLAACALTVVTRLQLGGSTWSPRQSGDRVRAAVAFLAVVVSLPWLAAELGFFLDGVPLLGRVYQTGKIERETPTVSTVVPTVHHGHHHGLDALLLLLGALLLSRVVPSVQRRGLRLGLGLYLALLVAYAVGNLVNDGWDEQVVKRGWTNWLVPGVIRPTVSVAWGLIVLGAAVLYALAIWRAKRGPRPVVAQSAPALRA